MSRFSEIQAFVQVVESGSITKAAQRLNVAKSAVSRRLSDLESRLGVQLLNRTTRSLALTDSGRSLFERSVRILQDLEEAELTVSQKHCELSGQLRVAAPLSFGNRHLASAIHDFSLRHPKVEFDLDLNDRRVDLVEEGFDLAIRIGALEDSSFKARRLASTRQVVCASPAYLKEHGTPESMSDLSDHRCLVYTNTPSPEVWRYRNPDGSPAKIVVPTHLRASSGDFLADAARRGSGIVMEPDFIVYEAIENGDLVPVLTEYEWPSLNVYALYPPTRFLSRRVREFVDFLSERFSGVPYWQRCLECDG